MANNDIAVQLEKPEVDPQVMLLTNPPITMTGANIKFMSIWKKDDVEFAHIYVELIEIKETIGELDQADGQMYLEQLSQRAYNTVEWCKLIYPDGNERTMMAIVNQDSGRPGDDAINFMVNLQTKRDEHGWEVLGNGTVVDHNKDKQYTVTYVNAYTYALQQALDELRDKFNVPEHIAHYAMLNALPFFQEMYLPDMDKAAAKERWPGWAQAKKMARRMHQRAESLCPAPETFL